MGYLLMMTGVGFGEVSIKNRGINQTMQRRKTVMERNDAGACPICYQH